MRPSKEEHYLHADNFESGETETHLFSGLLSWRAREYIFEDLKERKKDIELHQNDFLEKETV